MVVGVVLRVVPGVFSTRPLISGTMGLLLRVDVDEVSILRGNVKSVVWVLYDKNIHPSNLRFLT